MYINKTEKKQYLNVSKKDLQCISFFINFTKCSQAAKDEINNICMTLFDSLSDNTSITYEKDI